MLLDAAHAESSGAVEIVAGHFENKMLVIDRQKWFEMPGEFEAMEEFCQQHSASDLYFTPSTFTERKRTPEFADKCSVVYIDADTCEPDNFRVSPSFSVETSPGKWQCYWLLDEPTDTQAVSMLARKISHAHHDQGCDTSSWPANKIMRVPGSTHAKTGTPYPVTLRGVTGEQFSLIQLEELYQDVTLPAEVQVSEVEMGDLPNAGAVAAKIPNDLLDIFLEGAPEGTDRSAVRFKFECDLFEDGFTPEEVFVAVQRAGGNLDKFTPQGRPDSLWHEVLKAQATVEAGAPVAELEPVRHGEAEMATVSFLSDEERAWVEENPTFVDEYVAWALSRSPQSAETYHRSLAFTVLSCVYGNWGYVVPQFGPTRLNYWCIIAGDTTKTRKSTARQLALEVIHHWEKRSGKVVDIGSDVTSEGLTKTLAERDGEVSLLHRDEFQGWLVELYSKNYQQGILERMTELYDGKVSRVIRATKGSGSNRAETTFNILVMGIKDKIADVLTNDNFASGFLPRFVWAVADPPPWKEEDEYISQLTGDEDLSKMDDAEVLRFANQFELARRAWNSKTPKRLLADDETWARWNQWKIDARKYVAGTVDEASLEPGRDRMAYTILKCAGLLAIHGRSDKIRMEHLLPVLAQAESWFADLKRMAAAISNSEFEARVDSLERMIATAKDGVLVRANVYKSKQFKGMRVGEVDEHIRSLIASGRAATAIRDGKKVLLVNTGEEE